MKVPDSLKLIYSSLIALLLVFAGNSHAAGGNYSSDVDFEPIMAMIQEGDYESAIDHLYAELDIDPDNPDILSLLGFSLRKNRNFDEALTYYQWALKVEPDHRGANEYLGELYLETNQFDKAIEQLEILDNLCSFNCKEYSTLKNAIDSYQQLRNNS